MCSPLQMWYLSDREEVKRIPRNIERTRKTKSNLSIQKSINGNTIQHKRIDRLCVYVHTTSPNGIEYIDEKERESGIGMEEHQQQHQW